jgi:hypothetical protein
MLHRSSLFILFAVSFFFGTVAEAQTDDAASGGADGTVATDEAGAVPSPEETATSAELSDEQHSTEAEYGTGEEGRSSTDPFEDPHEAYYFVGAFYRHMIIPEFMLNLFLDEGSGSDFPAFGADVTYRKDGFDIVGSLWLARAEGQGAMRASGDPVQDTEFVETDLWVVFLSGTFLWSTSFNDWFAIEYGLGVGIGFVIGDVYRTEAYPGSDGDYVPCARPGDPANPSYCEAPGIEAPNQCQDGAGHYGCNEGKWSDGGDVPNVVPWLAIPHLALRFKPIKQVMIRVEGGFGLGFFAGASAAYGF